MDNDNATPKSCLNLIHAARIDVPKCKKDDSVQDAHELCLNCTHALHSISRVNVIDNQLSTKKRSSSHTCTQFTKPFEKRPKILPPVINISFHANKHRFAVCTKT